jgi:signal transduction histidine kinase
VIETLLENNTDGIMILDAEGRVQDFSASMERMSGWTKEDAVGVHCTNILQLVDNEGRNPCGKGCPARESAASVFRDDCKMVAKGNHQIDVEVGCAVVPPSQSSDGATLVSVRDVQDLHHVKDLGSAILSMVSHELQTPVSVIRAYAGALARPEADWSSEFVRDKLTDIEEESARLSQLISKMLVTSRLEVGSLQLRKLLVSPQKTKSHRIMVDFASDFPHVVADPERIGEVLINLVENAIKFSPDGGAISITGESTDDEAIVCVSDEGIGISEEDWDRIFHRFVRVDDGKARTAPGMGIGLYLCNSIMEAHGGRIWVESELGKGSRFRFALPLKADH